MNKMLRSITAKQWLMWEAYAALEPFDELRADYRSAQIVQMLYNINRDSKKEPKGRKIEDFLLFREEEDLTDEQKQEHLGNKFRVMELIARAQAEAASESRQPPPRVHEFHYPGGGVAQPVVEASVALTQTEQDLLAKARAAMIRVQ